MQKLFCTLLLFLSIFYTQSMFGSESLRIKKSAVFVPERLGKVKLRFDDQGYNVEQNGVSHRLEADAVDPLLLKMNRTQLRAFQKLGRISVNQATNGEFTLKASSNVKGGGPISGAIAYWVTKSLCWGGVAIAGAGAAAGIVVGTVATAGTAPGAVIAGGSAYLLGAAATGTASAAAGAAVLTTAGVSVATASTVTVGVGMGGAAAAVAGIETASLAAGTAFTLCPFLP